MKKLSDNGKKRIRCACESQLCHDCKALNYCDTALGGSALCNVIHQINEEQKLKFYDIFFSDDKRDCDFEYKEEEDNNTEKKKENNMEKKDYKYLVFADSFKIIKTTEEFIAALETLKYNDLIDIDEYEVFDSLEIIEL